MPDSVLSRMPLAASGFEAMKISLDTGENMVGSGIQWMSAGFRMIHNFNAMASSCLEGFLTNIGCDTCDPSRRLADIQRQSFKRYWGIWERLLVDSLAQIQNERQAESDFIDLFTQKRTHQDWSLPYDDTDIMLDLPSLRVIDVSHPVKHRIDNYTLVFAPRAGHHSNIAERVALYLRDSGLTRMAIVEQKCADDIPLQINGKRHREDFSSQVKQYAQVMAHANRMTGKPAHLVAVCQPGPLLISALILNPQLGKTFGSAGSPMHTEAQKGFLTDFARLMGPDWVDNLMTLFGRRVGPDREGRGRQIYDGALQVLGFYYLGMDQHAHNFKRLLADLKKGDTPSVERQKAFYDWYNTVHHFPAGFVRDTYRKIFVNNDLIRGNLRIGKETVDIRDYPARVPIWALGGEADAIVPPRQATGHLDVIPAVPAAHKLDLTCDGGHMALFRSKRILKSHYSRIARFMLEHSD
jgi:polyhydroxyalkanoate depolymerase